MYGTLVPCGPGLRPLGWPESPMVRRIALGVLMPNTFIASHMTAAWVWGAAAEPGAPLRSIQLPSKRSANYQPRSTETLHIAHSRISRRDISFMDDLAVTTPLRTALDILRDPHTFNEAQMAACAELFRLYQGLRARVFENIHNARHPQRPLSRDRLAQLADFDGKQPPHRGRKVLG
jgi:hypothetical protein